jgi:hypothetical protein
MLGVKLGISLGIALLSSLEAEGIRLGASEGI